MNELAALLCVALLALAATLALIGFGEVAPSALVHLAFAVGIMPLILAAYLYFVPVLTRSGDATVAVRALPWLALAAGSLAFACFLRPGDVAHGFAIAALPAVAAAASIAGWTLARAKSAIGKPHPCLSWYLAAALCLVAALAAVLAMPLWPEQYLALKRLHLHLNMSGFIGITAVGTLQVLMPTVAGHPDPLAGARLKRDLPFAVAATLVIAGAAAWQGLLGIAGAALWGVPLWRLARAWDRQHRSLIMSWHGAAPALAAALAGFTLMLFHGVFHGTGIVTTRPAPVAFIALFLLPLVTGAATHLLPVWLRPGPQGSWHAALREQAGRWGGARAGLFLCGGTTYALGMRWGIALSALALLIFVVQVARGLARRESSN